MKKLVLVVSVLGLISTTSYAQKKSNNRPHETAKEMKANENGPRTSLNKIAAEIATGFKDLIGGADTIKLILGDAKARGKEADMQDALLKLKDAIAENKITEAQKKEVSEFLQNIVEYSSTTTADQAMVIEKMIVALPSVIKSGGLALESWIAKLAVFNKNSVNRSTVGDALDKAISKEEQAKIRKEC